MNSAPPLADLHSMEESAVVQDYSAVFSRVADEHQPFIVRRDGRDLAVVIPLEYLALVRDAFANQEVEKMAAKIEWDKILPGHRPPQHWFDDTDNPFEPEEAI